MTGSWVLPADTSKSQTTLEFILQKRNMEIEFGQWRLGDSNS